MFHWRLNPRPNTRPSHTNDVLQRQGSHTLSSTNMIRATSLRQEQDPGKLVTLWGTFREASKAA